MHRTPSKVVIPNLSESLKKYAYLCTVDILTYFIFLTYLYFWWAWPKGACRIQTKNRQGAGSANSDAYYIPVLTLDAASRPAASIARPTA